MSALIEVNTDGLAKLADTVGGWLGWNANAVERMAEAESYAKVRKVDAENAAALARLQGEDQVAQYILAREARKMNNIKQVVEKTQSMFAEGEQVSNEPVNPDWGNRFISIVEDISDDEMQKLWARILAGEIKHPKSYSLRTLELLRNITTDEAELFLTASKYIIDNRFLCTEKFAMCNLEELLILSDMGVICGNSNIHYDVNIPAGMMPTLCLNNDTHIKLYNNSDKKVTISIKGYSLSRAGSEILKLVDRQPDDNFIQSLADKYKDKISRITKIVNDGCLSIEVEL